MDRPIRSLVVSAGSAKSSTKTIATKTPRVRNCRPRYAAAPSWTASEISCIFGVPLPAASTPARSTKAMTSAMTAMTATPMKIAWSLPVTSRSAAIWEDIELLIHA